MSTLYQRIEEGLREELQQAVGRSRWRLWFRDTGVSNVDEDSVTLSVPTEVHRTWLEFTYGDLLRETCAQVLGEGVRVRLEVCDRQQAKRHLRDALPTRNVDWSRLRDAHRAPASLEAFVPHGGGRFAQLILRQLRDPAGGVPASRVFVRGPMASGKSLLLEGLATDVRREAPDQVLRLTMRDFTRRYVDTVRRGDMAGRQAFRRDLEGRRLLLLDNLDELGGRPGTQEELVRLLDRLPQTGTRVVVAGRTHPRDVEGLSDRLCSLLLAGAVVRLPLPQGAHLDAVLARAAERMGQVLPEDVREAIRARTRSVRGAVDLVERWAAGSHAVGRSLEVAWLDELAPGATATAQEEVVRRVKSLVASHYGIDARLLDQPTKVRAAAHPRRMAMYLVYRACALPLAALGQAFGLKSHSSVSRAIREIRGLRDVRPEIEQTLDGLLAQV